MCRSGLNLCCQASLVPSVCVEVLQAHQRKVAILHGWKLAQRVNLQDHICS